MNTIRAAVAAFQRDGFVHLSNCIPLNVIKHAQAAVPEVLESVERSFGRCRDCGGFHQDFQERDCGNLTRPFIQLFNVWAQSSAFRKLVFHSSISAKARAILQTKSVRLIHDQLLIKRPGDQATTAHIDGHYWPFEGRACTFWVPLTDISNGMGTLQFVRHSHNQDLRRAELLGVDEATARQAIADFIITEPQHPVGFNLRQGDVTIHDKWTIHCTASNASAQTRTALAIHVMDGQAKRTKAYGPMQQGHIDLFHWENIPERAEFCESVCPVL